jgi:hypothetical protein
VKGRPLGALAGFFDWQSQSRAVVGGVRFTDEERSRSRALFLDSEFRVLAASDGVGVLRETHPLRTSGQKRGSHADSNGRVIGSSRPQATKSIAALAGMAWSNSSCRGPRPGIRPVLPTMKLPEKSTAKT